MCDFEYVSHEATLERIYNSVSNLHSRTKYIFKKVFFSVNKPYKKRKDLKLQLSSDALVVQDWYEQWRLIDFKIRKQDSPPTAEDEFKDDRCTLKKCSISQKMSNFSGGNSSEHSIIAIIMSEQFLIPSHSLFYNHDVINIKEHVNGPYDVIVLDPPWWNKYIRRKRKADLNDSYCMMWNEELAEIPISNLLDTNGLVVVWCTNAESHISSLKNKIFPRWGVQFIAEWFWLKVTRKGELVTPFSPQNGKQPFERLLFGLKCDSRPLPLPPANKLLISVPSTIHSHKPPLHEVLQPYLPDKPRGLEIFARSLLPNWTSYGNEVLKLQNISLYEKT